MLPPGGKATTKVIGPVGNSCPKPRPPSAKRPASGAATRTARRATIVRFLPMPGRVYAQSVRAYVAAPKRSFGLSICHAPRSRLSGQGRATYALASAPPVRLFWHSLGRGGSPSSSRGFSVGTRVAAALPRQPAFASKLLQMVLACYASWRHRKESTDALHCNRCIGFCICGVCPRRKQRPQSHPERRRRRHGKQGGRRDRTAHRQAGNLLASLGPPAETTG